MALKLMYITNRADVAKIAEQSGVDRIFVDMEYIGKDARQGGMNTVQNHHTIDDIKTVRRAVSKAEVLVRVNPMHPAAEGYCDSKEEINAAIEAGADVLMLPYFTTGKEVREFVSIVGKRATKMLLVETPEAVEHLDEILNIEGIDEIHIGLNDLSLGYGMKFMFELLADGTVERLCKQIGEKGIPFGFGGIGRIGAGLLSAERIIREHYRLGSRCAILSRSFCNLNQMSNVEEIQALFDTEVKKIRALEVECMSADKAYFAENQAEVINAVQAICEG